MLLSANLLIYFFIHNEALQIKWVNQEVLVKVFLNWKAATHFFKNLTKENKSCKLILWIRNNICK